MKRNTSSMFSEIIMLDPGIKEMLNIYDSCNIKRILLSFFPLPWDLNSFDILISRVHSSFVTLCLKIQNTAFKTSNIFLNTFYHK